MSLIVPKTGLVLPRRTVLSGGSLLAGLMLSGCEKLGAGPTGTEVLDRAEGLTFKVQRSLSSRVALAPEYRLDQRSPRFRTNGNTMPGDPAYAAHMAQNFANWKLVVDGLVGTPLALSLADLRAMPMREQVTAHNCVEGWTAIAKWTGVQLGFILRHANLRDTARYFVFHCADDFSGSTYYESIDRVDAMHPQTILAWAMNDAPLPVGNGAPLRLRVERQLGYKQAKYVMRVEAVDSLARIGQGKGGYWEDHIDYEWYAGA